MLLHVVVRGIAKFVDGTPSKPTAGSLSEFCLEDCHSMELLQSRRGVTQLGEPGEMMTDHGFPLLPL
jgi:hypothetical protein